VALLTLDVTKTSLVSLFDIALFQTALPRSIAFNPCLQSSISIRETRDKNSMTSDSSLDAMSGSTRQALNQLRKLIPPLSDKVLHYNIKSFDV